MILYINQTEINPSILCNKFDFQPYLSTYLDEPLNNAKNVTNVSFNVGNTLVGKVYTPVIQSSTVLVKANLMDTNISAVKGKINHKPVVDFEYSFVDGDIVLNNLSTDPDGDALAYNWIISDDVNFDSKNVKYTFQHTGIHSITLTASDGELSDTKTITLTTEEAEGYSEYILVDMNIVQKGNVFEIEDISTAKNVYSYDRKWFLDDTELNTTVSKIELTLTDREKHKISLQCESGKFTDTKHNYLYADLEPIISVREITVNAGQTLELSSENSWSVGDEITTYTWVEDPEG
jgi:PKD repeat protein